jgi:hypothetical protein
MAAEITQIDAQSFLFQSYEGQDTSLISTIEINTFLTTGSYIELFIYDLNQNILTSDYNFSQYTILNNGQSAGSNNSISQIEIDPEKVLIDNGFDQGEYITYFNFFNKQVGSELQQLYISEISSDRTELRLDNTSLTDLDLTEQTNNFIQQRENSPYFVDFYLNFGENEFVIANNIQLDTTDPTNISVLVKLYDPLPEQFNLNSQLWVVTSIDEPLAYQVTFEDLPIIITDTVNVKGPNFNLDLKDQVNNSTVSLDYATLTTTTLTSSFNQLSSLLEEKEIDINIDYTNFSNFIHFSSIQTRLENFYYKVSLLEEYSSSIAILNNTTNNNPSASIAIYESYINNIITNFDGYEYYLYYSSGSWAWPKLNNQPPYQLATTGSSQVLTWFGSTNPSNANYGGIILSSSIYDESNKDYLYYVIPEYLRDDPNNEQYKTFVNMVGQFYDNIWIYYKDVTEKYSADNRLEYGISKDIVADAIRDFGIKLYQNNFSIQDLYTAFIGLTPEGGLFPFPNITGSLPTPSGFEYIDTLISASNDYMPLDDVNKSLYKRIYHNLPYLLKSKGTLPGLRTLITSYGIPDTVLRINEYGGKDKVNYNDWDYWQDTFNYAFYTTGSNYISSSWSVNTDWNSFDNVPNTLQFRFRTNGLPTGSIPYSQSLWFNDLTSTIVLEYTGSGYTSGSHSGSIIDPYYQYANLIFYPDITNYPNSSASVYLPFFDGGWWPVMVTRTLDEGYGIFQLHAGNKIYEGGDNGVKYGFYSSSIVIENDNAWKNSILSYFARGNVYGSKSYTPFSGSLQEIRYYSPVLDKYVFFDYIMNPHSTEGTYASYPINTDPNNSPPSELMFRASLGGELYTGSTSIHPKVTGSWSLTSSFPPTLGGNNFSFHFPPKFIPNTEYFFYTQPIVGIKNAVSNKIRLENDTLPSGDTLSAFRSLAQNVEISQSYTPNNNYLEVAFVPQNEIDEDIMDQLKAFNIGDYIGDPRFRSSSALSYSELDTLRNEYFEKYTKNYDLNDYIRLIKFFDNSLFKMIKDFVPARTSLASGIVIKQHILERNRYPQPQVDNYSTIAYATSGSQNNVPFTFQNIVVSGTLTPSWNNYQPGTVENFSGGPAGIFNPYNSVLTSPYGANGTGPNNIYFLTQSWLETIPTISGSVLRLHSTQDEFYNGEFSGSVLTVTTQSLAQPYPLQNESFAYKQVYYYGTGSNESNIFEGFYLNNVTSPQNGEILFFEQFFGTTLGSIVGSHKYLKIAKIDCNGDNNTTVLGQLDSILINTPISPLSNKVWIQYDVTILNEQSNYYLYKVESAKYLNQTIFYVSSWYPNQILDYTVSASGANLGGITFSTVVKPYGSTSGNSLGYFNATTGIYTLANTPNTPLSVTGSITVGGLGGVGRLELYLTRQGNTTLLSNISIASGNSYSVSSLYYGLQGDQIYLLCVRTSGILSANGGSLLVTQSRAVSASNCESVIFEPYVTEPNYYYSNFNPIMNSIEDERLSTIYEDISYSTGILTPTNFAQLISGSAIKAAVQDSNYTSKRVINPRYNGVKSTSQYLNTWTPGDVGTYGKTPTAEDLKTMVAYCDSISGWPSERMNASAIHVLYLIKSDGTVIIPNTSKNSLYDIRGTFETGERMLINTQTISAGGAQYRNIIRGGTRIEPILYTQFGSAPNATWNTTMSFEDIILTSSGSVGNYTALYNNITTQTIPGDNNFYTVTFPNTVNGIPVTSNGYQIPLNAISDGVNIILTANIRIAAYLYSTILGPFNVNTVLQFFKNGIPYSTPSLPIQTAISSNNLNNPTVFTISFSTTISNANLIAGDIYTVGINRDNPNFIQGYNIQVFGTNFHVTQQPIPTSFVTSSGYNSIWGWPNKTLYPNIITSSNSTLVNLYGDSNVKMVDITGSGFNPVTLPWSIKYADEFRFEGREDFVYQVGKIFSPSESGSDRITQTGSIEIHFNYDLPVSASSSIFNLDHFLIRRYIDDASLILMEGYRPINASGPYIIRPEYIVPELNKSVDQFILDLTQKGLI